MNERIRTYKYGVFYGEWMRLLYEQGHWKILLTEKTKTIVITYQGKIYGHSRDDQVGWHSKSYFINRDILTRAQKFRLMRRLF